MAARTDVGDIISAVFPYIIALAVAMARPTGLMAVLPVFTRLGTTPLLRGGMAFGLSLPAVPQILAALQSQPALDPMAITPFIVKEAFVGLLLGIAFGVPFWAVESAGNIIDFQRGASTASIIDPSAEDQSVLGDLFAMTLIALFVMAGGFDILLGGVYESYRIWPSLEFLPRLSSDAAGLYLTLLDRIFQIALVIAGPLLIAMFLGELALALISRFAPQLNVFNLGMSVKSLVLVVLLPIYATFLVEQFASTLAPLKNAVEQLQGVIR